MLPYGTPLSRSFPYSRAGAVPGGAPGNTRLPSASPVGLAKPGSDWAADALGSSRWGRSYKSHVAAQIGLHASLSSLTEKAIKRSTALLPIAPASAKLHVGYRFPICCNP